MQKFSITIQGTNTLLMHSARLSNPLDPATKAMKEVSGKRKKTDDDHLELARLEHAGSMYHDQELGPYIPGDNVWRSLHDASKKFKLGVRFKEGVLITTDTNPLVYDGPRDIDGLWEDKNFVNQASVKVMTSRVIRTRPQFREWATVVEGILDTNVLDFAELEQITETAGQLIGLGDWRPRYGRYTATVKETK